ncbi:hypothetical protein HOLDEFILI_00362 [Holdemania filiformis DSM 12042]|uniref:Uncharacterized protein n=1 Tax=Holdemania filiformis DSM 12042 TaxID=545696 RepID=B9Y3I7_9FIRM|nr:hypothetical protein HOLDEFILI_00362 [Holdemania filiformis DSM 12042]
MPRRIEKKTVPAKNYQLTVISLKSRCSQGFSRCSVFYYLGNSRSNSFNFSCFQRAVTELSLNSSLVLAWPSASFRGNLAQLIPLRICSTASRKLDWFYPYALISVKRGAGISDVLYPSLLFF